MRWLFIDEQIEKGPYGQFFALTFVAIPGQQLGIVRDDLIKRLLPILSKEPRVIPRFPVLHGSDLLRDHDDAEKLAAYQAVVNVVLHHDLKIGRLGYYNKDYLGDITFNRPIANHSLIDLALRSFEDHIVPIYEFDVSRRKEIRNQVNDFQHQYTRIKLSNSALTLPFHRILGVHFAEKENHWMQITDIVSYLLWACFRWNEADEATSFKKALLNCGQRLLPAVIYSETIQVNDPAYRPPEGPAGFRPITKAFEVNPSDTEDLSAQARRHVDHLRSVFERRKAERDTDAT